MPRWWIISSRISPRLSYQLNAWFEDYAEHEYMEFVRDNPDLEKVPFKSLGATSGIGAEFAQQLAEQGFDLLLVARRTQKLEALREKLSDAHGVQVRVVSADLSVPEGVDAVAEAASDLNVGLLINNAGAGNVGRFTGSDEEVESRILYLNTVSPMRLRGRTLARTSLGTSPQFSMPRRSGGPSWWATRWAGSSPESRPISVGRSKATDSPV